jgi:hypothetical protein
MSEDGKVQNKKNNVKGAECEKAKKKFTLFFRVPIYFCQPIVSERSKGKIYYFG